MFICGRSWREAMIQWDAEWNIGEGSIGLFVVDGRDASEILDFWNAYSAVFWRRFGTDEAKRLCIVGYSGYDADPRPLNLIPEFAAAARQVVNERPEALLLEADMRLRLRPVGEPAVGMLMLSVRPVDVVDSSDLGSDDDQQRRKITFELHPLERSDADRIAVGLAGAIAGLSVAGRSRAAAIISNPEIGFGGLLRLASPDSLAAFKESLSLPVWD